MHHRAEPNVRGSGRERGHGTELTYCPKCGEDITPGKHHIGCAAGKSAPRQSAKRRRVMEREAKKLMTTTPLNENDNCSIAPFVMPTDDDEAEYVLQNLHHTSDVISEHYGMLKPVWNERIKFITS